MLKFSPPRLDQTTVDAVSEVLLSGWITTGPKTKQFEKEISDYVGCRKTICLNSATAGLELVCRWFGLKEGDEVIVPAYTYCASANIILHCGAKPVLVDIDEKDFNISVNNIREAITENTKIIIPVDIGGWPCDYDLINELVNEPSIKAVFTPNNEVQKKLGRLLVMSDAAHSIGASMNGKMTGSLADITVFSFHAVKNLTTAEGGAVCMNLPEQFDCDEVYQILNIKSLHGQSKDALAKTQVGNWRYDVLEPGYKCNMMDIQAAIGLVELHRYDETLKRRKEIVNYYANALGQYDWAQIPDFISESKESSYHLFLLRIKDITEDQRDEIISKIFDKQVSVNVHFQPLPLLTAYNTRGYKMEDYPEAFNKYHNEITLPVYFDLTDSDLELVVNAVVESVSEVI
ncbi:DegT/DnrJ/EryC1/StrS family aminotransferase [Paracrocinitomix mangrovi]|uniref:DegT/DnrJ/EryC1/StrS family aminotransferase n=1 Tax=Paracrocinitomix mangrovi TaxID=2862509 RepID=UPI001C8EC272|nr:DegT/DnrJ/EryC1/StrS family aminotransferase [Paracrocinitomix mangrovi]UKN03303.1 DegT/DnrJ/EryC1/StrS family aminotransferase [Paracrocinitomix mangrovi]